MNRRDALERVALLLGGTIVGGQLFLQGCTSPAPPETGNHFSPEDIALLDEVSETIIPTTDTPGAKAAGVSTFITTMVNDCYTEKEQEIFHKGVDKINALCRQKHDHDFMSATAEQRKALLTELDKEQQAYTKNKKEGEPAHYFRMMKELTVLGYFNSEIGATQALRYVKVPTRFDGCIPYTKGEKAWAT